MSAQLPYEMLIMGSFEMNSEHSGQDPKLCGSHHCPNCGAGYYFSSIYGLKDGIAKPFIK